jgi:hypothetical protein
MGYLVNALKALELYPLKSFHWWTLYSASVKMKGKVLRRLTQQHCEFEANLGYKERLGHMEI